MIATSTDAGIIRREIRQLRAEMKRANVRKVSCFNGGLTPDERRYNQELFRLNTILKSIS